MRHRRSLELGGLIKQSLVRGRKSTWGTFSEHLWLSFASRGDKRAPARRAAWDPARTRHTEDGSQWDLLGDKKQEPSCLPRVKQQTCVPSGGMTPLLIFLFGKPSLGVKGLSYVPGSAAMEPAELQLGQEPDAADTRLGLLCRKTTYRKQFIGYYPAHSTLWCPESLCFPAPIAFAPELSFPEPAAVETEGQNEAHLNCCLSGCTRRFAAYPEITC